MKEQYFITKLKDEFLPVCFFESIEKGKIKSFYPWNNALFFIELKFLRKIKIQNIQSDIDSEDKLLLEFLLNDNFVKMLNEEESKITIDKLSYSSSSSGTAGGVTGCVGITGSSVGTWKYPPSNIVNNWNKLGIV
jgi:hypothetical protein